MGRVDDINHLQSRIGELLPRIVFLDGQITTLKEYLRGMDVHPLEIQHQIMRYLMAYTRLKDQMRDYKNSLDKLKMQERLDNLRQ